ncbi:MAG: sensor histidine kinase [Burkholderiaceae bacterium]|nr:sensor histidine kinase [Burkholderiaceae bacterium]
MFRLLGLLWLLASLAPVVLHAEPVRHREAQFSLSASAASVPSADADWRRVILPDQWQAGRNEAAGWYRIDFEVDRKDGQPWMVYLPRLREGGTLYLNGELLARVPEPDAQTWVRWMRPHALPVAPAQLRLGGNTLMLRVNLGNRDRIVSTVHIGPDGAVRPRYEARYFVTYTMAQITIALTTAVGLFVVAVWWRRRMELDYGLFGLGCLFWAVHTLNYVIETVPDPWWIYWRVVRYAATGGFGVTMTLFYLRHAGFRPRGMTRAFIAYWASGPLLLALGGSAVHGFVDRYYQGGLLLVGLIMIGAAVRSVMQRRDRYNIALLLSALLGMGGSIHDYLLSQGKVVDPEGPYLLYFAAAALMTTVGAILVDRFVQSLSAVEQANATLRRTVAEREQELAASYARLREHEREQAVAGERQRIMQDMHDGLGSQLLTSLAAVERGQLDAKGVAQALREAIDDMRLSIDTLAPGRDGLLESIGNLRWRLEPRFRAAGIELRFKLDGLPDRIDAPPHVALQVLRILQESLTNAMKHAHTPTISVTLGLVHAPERLWVEVSDEGSGFRTEAPTAGRGLSGMQRRAASIGASLSVDSGAGGTRVRLTVPLPQDGTGATVPSAA